MADISDSVSQIRESVSDDADASGNRSYYISAWNARIDQAISALQATQTEARRYLALDKKALAIIKSERATIDSGLSSVNSAYDDLANALLSGNGSDIRSVLGSYSSMKSGPYCSSVAIRNDYGKMDYNISVMEREIARRDRDIETLGQLKL